MLVLNNTHPFSIARAFWLVRTHTLDVCDGTAQHAGAEQHPPWFFPWSSLR